MHFLPIIEVTVRAKKKAKHIKNNSKKFQLL